MKGHKCKGKLFRLSTTGDVLTEIVEEGCEEHEEFLDAVENIQSAEVSKISLYALTGETEPQTIRVQGKVNGVMLSILVDSGSTHNFVQSTVARKLKLAVSPVKQFSVITGSGDELLCNKWCKDVKLAVQGTEIVVNLFILPMDGTKIVCHSLA